MCGCNLCTKGLEVLEILYNEGEFKTWEGCCGTHRCTVRITDYPYLDGYCQGKTPKRHRFTRVKNFRTWFQGVSHSYYCPFIRLPSGLKDFALECCDNDTDRDDVGIGGMKGAEGKPEDGEREKTALASLPVPAEELKNVKAEAEKEWNMRVEANMAKNAKEQEKLERSVTMLRKRCRTMKKNHRETTKRLDKQVETTNELKRRLDDLESKSLCVVCLDAEADCLFLNCGHLKCCMTCAKGIETCCMCRVPICNKRQRVYL